MWCPLSLTDSVTKNNRLQRYLSISHRYPSYFLDLEMLTPRYLGHHGYSNSVDHNYPSRLDCCSPSSYHFPLYNPRPTCTPSLQKAQLQCSPRSPTPTNHNPSPSSNSSQSSLSPPHHSRLPLPRHQIPPLSSPCGNIPCFYTCDSRHFSRHHKSVLEPRLLWKGLTVAFRADVGHP